MSAPDTNIEKQEREHKPSLIGIRLAVAVGLGVLVAVLFTTFNNAEDPDAVQPAVTAQ